MLPVINNIDITKLVTLLKNTLLIEPVLLFFLNPDVIHIVSAKNNMIINIIKII